MHTLSVRARARRAALAAMVAALTTTSIVASAPAPAVPAPAERTAESGVAPGLPRAHPHRVERQAELRAEREAELRAERRAELRAEREAAEAAQGRGEQIVALASNEAGDPYAWGAAGPDAFDCSGFTQYVFAQVGIALPHSSSAQAAMAQPVSDPQPGDLVFFTGSGGVYHVAIYAGDGYVWHSPRSGDVVNKAQIWTSSVFYGRVG
ncbi:C40 family peptidase [Nocardioides pelophilus]|uniref:C40 family peptidase n=1 Tax=Nocardioides pelophilus TaxID=2172019 RepID=UPI001C7F5260|nr:C40 family peptidase [Nocardioides pelophilus]